MTPEEIVSLVSAAGIVCRKSFFPGKVPALTQAMAVVHRKQVRDGVEEFSVTAAVPSFLGGLLCEDTAWSIYKVLTDHGGSCTLAPCEFDGQADCFFQEVTVSWVESELSESV